MDAYPEGKSNADGPSSVPSLFPKVVTPIRHHETTVSLDEKTMGYAHFENLASTFAHRIPENGFPTIRCHGQAEPELSETNAFFYETSTDAEARVTRNAFSATEVALKQQIGKP